jgi:hypothetical protein
MPSWRQALYIPLLVFVLVSSRPHNSQGVDLIHAVSHHKAVIGSGDD